MCDITITDSMHFCRVMIIEGDHVTAVTSSKCLVLGQHIEQLYSLFFVLIDK